MPGRRAPRAPSRHAALVTASLYALAWALYLGFQAAIRVVVYPQFALVPAEGFARYEAAHQRRVTALVLPLFACLLLASVAVVWRPPDGAGALLVAAAALPLPVVLGVTFLGAVPQHRRLLHGFDRLAHRRLLRADSVRLAASCAGFLLGLGLLLSA